MKLSSRILFGLIGWTAVLACANCARPQQEQKAESQALLEAFARAWKEEKPREVRKLVAADSPHWESISDEIKLSWRQFDFSAVDVKIIDRPDDAPLVVRAQLTFDGIELGKRRKSKLEYWRRFELVRVDDRLVIRNAADEIERAAIQLISKQTELDKFLAANSELVSKELVEAVAIQARRQDDEIRKIAIRAMDSITSRIQDPAHRAGALVSIGSFLGDVDHNKQAIEYYKNAKTIVDENGLTWLLPELHNNLGTAHDLMGEFDVSIGHYRKSLEIARKEGDRLIEGFALGHIGTHYRQRQGQPEDSLGPLNQSLQILESIKESPVAYKALSINWLQIAIAYKQHADLRPALVAYSKADAIARELKLEGVSASAVNEMGTIHIRLGNPEAARAKFENALAVFERLNHRGGISTTLLNLALLHRDAKQYDLALSRARRSLILAQKAESQRRICTRHIFLGQVYADMKDYAAASDEWRKAMRIADAQGYDRERAIIYKEEARVHLANNDGKSAISAAEKGLEIAKTLYDFDVQSELHVLAGRANLMARRLSDAERNFLLAIHAIELTRDLAIGAPADLQRFFEKRTKPYVEMVDLLASAGRDEEALSFAEQTKARVLLDVLRQSDRTPSGMPTSEESALREQLQQIRSDLRVAEKAKPKNQESLKELRDRFARVRIELDDLSTRRIAADPALRLRTGRLEPIAVSSLTPTEIPIDTAILEFSVHADRTHLFVITFDDNRQAQLQRFTVKTSVEDLQGSLTEFHDLLQNGRRRTRAKGQEIFNVLFSEAYSAIQAKSNWILIPDKVLWSLPFQALQRPDGVYLIEDHSIRYCQSLAVREQFAGSASQLSAPLSVKVFANPSGLPAEFKNLKHALTEGAAIRRVVGRDSCELLTGRGATELSAKETANGNYDILHFATHAEFISTRPLYSSLLLSPTKRGNSELIEDGYFEAREVMSMQLPAKLVVLSACETGRGKIGNGEGIVGLTWAFMIAGCRDAVVSQWKVDSEGTSVLMQRFYHYLLNESLPPDAALRQAQLDLLEGRTPQTKNHEFRHAFHWAAFQVIASN